MTNSLTAIVEKTEEEEPPPSVSVDRLNSFLDRLKAKYPKLDRIAAYDNHDSIYICIGDFPDRNLKNDIPYEAFRIFNDGNVADNNKLSKIHGCGELHIKIRKYLVKKGYSKFYNAY